MTERKHRIATAITVLSLIVMAAALLADGPPVTRYTVALIALTAWCGGIMWMM